VAVGVLDLLPHCVSAVYFFYHEDIHAYNPGKLGALREIALALEGGYRYWYSGYYIHTCPKMRYKMDYSPQYVLDPETLTWDLVDKEVLALFDRMPYLSLSSQQKRLATKGDATSDESPSSLGGAYAAQGTADTAQDMEAGKEEGDEDDADAFLLTSNMPGIPSLAQMRQVDMDSILVRSDYADSFFLTSDLVVWPQQDIADYPSIKSKVAELVAVVGPDLTEEFCLDFRDRRRGSG
jgi:arginine-tRNA-protein transferase